MFASILGDYWVFLAKVKISKKKETMFGDQIAKRLLCYTRALLSLPSHIKKVFLAERDRSSWIFQRVSLPAALPDRTNQKEDHKLNRYHGFQWNFAYM